MGASDGCLAQLVERRPYKANVGGSIPSAPTNSYRVTHLPETTTVGNATAGTREVRAAIC